MKLTDDAVFYSETLRDLGVEDPLGGETQADKELREASTRHAENVRALKETVAQDWGRMSVSPAGTKAPRKRARARG